MPSLAPTFADRRTLINDGQITMLGWPSRGGVIVLEWVSSVDYMFLGLDRYELLLKRAADQAVEDEFCKRLLLLGAKWFDSEARWRWYEDVREGDELACHQLEMEEFPEPTLSERRCIVVGWPNSDGSTTGGLWVAEYDNGMPYGEEEWADQVCPSEFLARVMLCNNMVERCKVLEAHGARFYEKLDDYSGSGFLKAWQEKHSGVVGALVTTSIAQAKRMLMPRVGCREVGGRPRRGSAIDELQRLFGSWNGIKTNIDWITHIVFGNESVHDRLSNV